MCCFSRPVQSVTNTRIFARPDKDDRQFIVYQMNFEAKEDLAMILPLPVKKGSGEDAVDFIDLSGYTTFFDSLFGGFLPPPKIHIGVGCNMTEYPPPTAALAVVEVGDYEASFVPTLNDFNRLDSRFRLPDGTWERLPAYKEYGFAVFKLSEKAKSPSTRPPGTGRTVHPIAFTFPTAYSRVLFFPTFHIHDGIVHDEAGFEHTLYCQPARGRGLNNLAWHESGKLAKAFMDLTRSKSVIAGDQHCYKLEMIGKLANRDVTVAVG